MRPPTYIEVTCPSCGLKINLRRSSIDTLRTCENCRQKFVVRDEPQVPQPSSPSPSTTADFPIVGCLLVVFFIVAIPAVFLVVVFAGILLTTSPSVAEPDVSNPEQQRVDDLHLKKDAAQGKGTAAHPAAQESSPPMVSTVPPVPKHEIRTWRSASGKFEVEATFVGMTNGKVVLRQTGGDEIVVDLAKLSTDDVDYIEGLRGANKLGGR